MTKSCCHHLVVSLAASSFCLLLLCVFTPWIGIVSFPPTQSDDDWPLSKDPFDHAYYLGPIHGSLSRYVLVADKSYYGSENNCPEGFQTKSPSGIKEEACSKIGNSIISVSFALAAQLLAVGFLCCNYCCRSRALVILAAITAFGTVCSTLAAIIFLTTLDIGVQRMYLALGMIEAIFAIVLALATGILSVVIACRWHKHAFSRLQNIEPEYPLVYQPGQPPMMRAMPMHPMSASDC
eukprot:TRINITY_DN10438_c1_g1_i1.p2 TRINITY_DN10438_c1_g1~~TRINITY_DN10438_c1_g1_i1.p2  ORF type:complete len:237 (+),score=19.37 TRINITY_DN10438_c1_g1_i1:178-888(+)